jgi:chaperonin GroES
MIRPLRKRILVTQEKEKPSASGILLPDSGKERPERGVVVSVGSDVTDIPVGSTVLFKKYAPDDVTVDEIDYLVIAADDVLAVIE